MSGHRDVAMDQFICPKCGGSRHKQWTPSHPIIVFWLVNPGVAFNEVFVGQRIPEATYFCEACPEPFQERSYVFCPNCRTYHSGRVWGERNSFGHWAGLVCPDCGAQIPTLTNYTSRLLLALLFPLWWLPSRLAKAQWIHFEQRRAQQTRKQLKPYRVNWILRGLFKFGPLLWALLMIPLAVMLVVTWRLGAVPPETALTVGCGIALFALLLCLAGGVAWGCVMKVWMEKRP